MKKTILTLILMLVCACHGGGYGESCPKIEINRDKSRMFVNNGNFDALQINLVGFTSYCYADEKTRQYYAVITPQFKLRRMEDSTLSSVDVPFYISAKDMGKGIIGDGRYQQTLRIPLEKKEVSLPARSITRRIAPPPYGNEAIELGLDLSEYAYAKSKSMYDIDYKYLSQEDLADVIQLPPERVFLEIGPDEKVVYCEKSGRPIVVKKGVISAPCN
ncbi:MAG: hypothetical protein IJ184_05975 [Alphaproteobacteria bacterium]|nr:hypothetical protein [Alphaproteobacteria bacterium]